MRKILRVALVIWMATALVAAGLACGGGDGGDDDSSDSTYVAREAITGALVSENELD